MKKHIAHVRLVNSEKISNNFPGAKGGSTDDLRMSEAGITDLRYETLASRLNKVESYLEKIVQPIAVNDSRHATVSPPKKKHRVETTSETQVRPRPTPAASCAGSHRQTEIANDDTVSEFLVLFYNLEYRMLEL